MSTKISTQHFKPLIGIFLCLALISCNRSSPKFQEAEIPKRETENGRTNPVLRDSVSVSEPAPRDTAIEVMDEKAIRLNGKLQRYFTSAQFHSVFGKPDSVKLLTEEEPCANIFQEPDGSVYPQAKYLFKNGSRFENSRDKVAIDEVKFEHGDFIIFKQTTLNKNTTLADLKKIFPNAARQIGQLNVAGQGEFQVFQLREDRANISDGHINVFIKNGKLYSIQWWFPC